MAGLGLVETKKSLLGRHGVLRSAWVKVRGVSACFGRAGARFRKWTDLLSFLFPENHQANFLYRLSYCGAAIFCRGGNFVSLIYIVHKRHSYEICAEYHQ